MNAKHVWLVALLTVCQDPARSGPALAVSAAAVAPADPMIRLITSKGKVRVEGSSSIDDWQVESRSLEGFMEVSSDFPGRSAAGKGLAPVRARAEAWLDVRSLKSVEKDGKPFSNRMDEIMHEALRSHEHPRIIYRLTSLSLKSGLATAEAGATLVARGQLVVGGVTNELAMPMTVVWAGPDQLKVSGTAGLKMTDFQIDPPSPKIALGLIRTRDDVRFSVEWLLVRRH